jgi:hypothetical protein
MTFSSREHSFSFYYRPTRRGRAGGGGVDSVYAVRPVAGEFGTAAYRRVFATRGPISGRLRPNIAGDGERRSIQQS